MGSVRKKRLGLLLLLVFAVFLGSSARNLYRKVRQPEMNRALIDAVKKDNAAGVISLLAAGANPNAKEIPPNTRSLWLLLWDRLRGKPLPRELGPTALVVALESNTAGWPPENVPMVTALLDAGAAIEAADEDGTTPLVWATWAGKWKTVRLLLTRKAGVNAHSLSGYTALHGAAREDNPDLVKLLLARGAFVNARDNYDSTPLHFAAFGGHTEIVRILLDHGGDIDARDRADDTPLSIAGRYNHADCVKFLLARGASANTKTPADDTSLK